MTQPWNGPRQKGFIKAIASAFNMENIHLPGNHPIAPLVISSKEATSTITDIMPSGIYTGGRSAATGED